jgi:two-component system OmpR family response regulator
MRALLIEDDTMIADGVLTALRREGYSADWLRDGQIASDTLKSFRFDIVLLDLGLPRRDGLDLLREFRARDDATPVIVLTARDEVRQRVAGLDAGADDYLVKPFDLDELIARMRSLRRRSAGRATPVIEHRGVRMDTVTRAVWKDDTLVALSAKEYAVLEALLLRPGAVLSRQQLEDRIYTWKDQVGSNAVEVYVHSLRRKLGADFIRTLRGVGYCVAS